MNPIRIQRKRAKGYKMPPNTVSVTRPGKWGNPFVVGEFGTREECLNAFTYLMQGNICLTSKSTIDKQKKYYNHVKENLKELKGKNLACFCPLNKPCHADILLEIANQ